MFLGIPEIRLVKSHLQCPVVNGSYIWQNENHSQRYLYTSGHHRCLLVNDCYRHLIPSCPEKYPFKVHRIEEYWAANLWRRATVMPVQGYFGRWVRAGTQLTQVHKETCVEDLSACWPRLPTAACGGSRVQKGNLHRCLKRLSSQSCLSGRVFRKSWGTLKKHVVWDL